MAGNKDVDPTEVKGRGAGALLNARATYFFYYMALAAFMPFITLYYARLGLSGTQIGVLVALPTLVASPAALAWGMLADALHWHRGLFRAALLLSPVAVLALSQASRLSTLTVIVVVYALFSGPILPLLDSAALEVSASGRRTYGDLRVWGTIGWAVSTWLLGSWIQRFGLSWLFVGYALFMAVTFVASLFQPARIDVLRTSLGAGLRSLVSQPGFFLFLVSLFLLTITTGGVNFFFSLYLEGIGADEATIGLAWTLAAVSEIPVMLGSGALIKGIGETGLLAIAFVTYAVRWLLYSFIATPWLALPVQLLHGLSFAAFLTGGVTYMGHRAPPGMGTSAQAVFNAVAYSIGPFVGALLVGFLFDRVGMSVLFRILCLLVLVALGTFWASTRLSGVRVFRNA